MLAQGTVLQNRYHIVRLIAQGGMGAVYEARDERLGNTVALKETFFADESLRRAFEREARLLASVRHQALPKVSDHFSEGAGQFLVMEFIPGNDLASMLQNRKGLVFPPDQVLEWADQLLDALDYLHTLEPPVIHRDIKPQNLKLTARGQIILLDFGLAKGSIQPGATAAAGQSIFGYTPNYAPLEQIQAEGTNARSDLYSLAATLYHLVTGQMPPGALTRIAAVASGQPDTLRPANEINPEVSPAVANALIWAMSLNNNQRPQTAAIMRDALRSASKSSSTAPQNQATSPQAADTQKPAPPAPTVQAGAPSNPQMAPTQPDPLSQPQPSWPPPQSQPGWPPPQPSWPQQQQGWPAQMPQRKSKAPWIVGAIAAVLLLSAGVFAALYFSKDNTAENSLAEKADTSARTTSGNGSTSPSSGYEEKTTATTVDEVLSRYIEAIGGEDAVRAVTSRTVKASFEIADTGVVGTMETYAKPPDKYLTIISGPGGISTRVGFNGSLAWSKEPAGEMREIEGYELEGIKRDAAFYKELDFTGLYSDLSIKGKEKIKDRDVIVLEATLPEGGSDLLYFDVETALLVRADVTRQTQQGALSTENWFEDYRTVDGIRMPFTLRQSGPLISIVIRVREVRHNVQIRDSVFDQPSAP
ncbi:MAG: protein kinase [Acidobacteriota bacterium]